VAITKQDPNTIALTGRDTYRRVNDKVAEAAITPGMLVEMHNVAGIPKWRAHGTSTGTFAAKAFALEQLLWNKGVNDAYGVGDLVDVAIFEPGGVVWAIVPSGQTIVPGDALASNGDGKLFKSTTGSVARALESATTTADTRVRVEVL
jgi:hypothetical protein